MESKENFVQRADFRSQEEKLCQVRASLRIQTLDGSLERHQDRFNHLLAFGGIGGTTYQMHFARSNQAVVVWMRKMRSGGILHNSKRTRVGPQGQITSTNKRGYFSKSTRFIIKAKVDRGYVARLFERQAPVQAGRCQGVEYRAH